MRRSTLAAALCFGLFTAACANTPTPASGSSLDTTRLDVYEALIRHLAGQEGLDWQTVYVVRRICANAGDPEELTGCDDAFGTEEESVLLDRLSDLGAPVRFIDDPSFVYDEPGWLEGKVDGVVVRVGPIEGTGDQVNVGGSYGCGGLCASGSTYVLSRGEAGWEVTGTTGSVWIA